MSNIIKSEIFDYETSKHYIEQLSREYDFLRVNVISRTGLGRAIFSLDIGNRKNSVVYAAGFHGSEWLTPLVLFRFAERVCHCIKHNEQLCSVDISRALRELGITIIPCVNPDGTEIAVYGPAGAKHMHSFVEKVGKGSDFEKWNANAFGVDINHNFNAGWSLLRELEEQSGISGPAPRQYGGRAPESEAETKALASLCRMRSFRQALAIHSQGEELYWKYGDRTPAQSNMMAKILADSCSYTLVENADLASHGGFKDWFIDEFERPAFTMEVGKGENPLPVSSLDSIYEKVEEALTIFALM